TGPVIATLTAMDEGAGVYKTEYSLDGMQTWQEYTAPVEFVAEEVPVLYARSVDLAGNHEYPAVSYQLRPFIYATYIPLIRN
ncbi:MAG: OmpL47-type beta-barrel domain-containing protein, partial [Candidatus Promineifilaceae bacterium]